MAPGNLYRTGIEAQNCLVSGVFVFVVVLRVVIQRQMLKSDCQHISNLRFGVATASPDTNNPNCCSALAIPQPAICLYHQIASANHSGELKFLVPRSANIHGEIRQAICHLVVASVHPLNRVCPEFWGDPSAAKMVKKSVDDPSDNWFIVRVMQPRPETLFFMAELSP